VPADTARTRARRENARASRQCEQSQCDGLGRRHARGRTLDRHPVDRGFRQSGSIAPSPKSFQQARAESQSLPILFFLQNVRLGDLPLAHRLPAIFEYREFAAAGGLAGYVGNSNEAHRLLAEYAARILKGEKPADLPVQQYARFELILNLKTAK